MAKTKTKVEVIKSGGGPLGWVFFTAWVGALVYFVQQSEGFWDGVLGVLQSFVWPAFVVYEALKALGVS